MMIQQVFISCFELLAGVTIENVKKIGLTEKNKRVNLEVKSKKAPQQLEMGRDGASFARVVKESNTKGNILCSFLIKS